MVSIRLRRVGAKHKPIYRILVADKRSPRDGAFIETIGHYNPLTNPATFDINEEKALEWLNRGAQPTDTVKSLLRKSGMLDKFKPQSISGPESTIREAK
jgi:small subunit ribosomal protein S16